MKPSLSKIPVRLKSGGMRNVIVDSIDATLREFKWHEPKPGGYPRRSTKVQKGSLLLEQEAGGYRDEPVWKSVSVYLHREIAGLPPGDPTFQVHHASHDLYDCRRVNLWVCTPAFNARHQKNALGTMLEELARVDAKQVECWPLAQADSALLHLLHLHVERRGQPLRRFLPDLDTIHAKLKTPPTPSEYYASLAPLVSCSTRRITPKPRREGEALDRA